MKAFTIILFLSTWVVSSQNDERKFSLFFENDVYELNENHHRLLDSIKGFSDKDLLDVHIKGYTNSIGSENYNLELSRKRAENTKAELRQFTIISSIGYGELESASANNRRVDILVHHKVDHIPEVGEIVELPTVPESQQPTITSLVQPKAGDKVILQGIMFYTDRDVMMNESKHVLKELVKFLKSNPQIKFKLIGHICCADPMKPEKDLRNVRTGKNNLSEARARALYNYLAKKGIKKNRMRYIGMAFRQPTGKGDQFDRRVEIEITSVD